VCQNGLGFICIQDNMTACDGEYNPHPQNVEKGHEYNLTAGQAGMRVPWVQDHKIILLMI
jgi:hypothetical protein